jgi:glycosyltransferase involved in cell wall biosynthesis
MSRQPIFSIITPTHNRCESLRRAIASVQAQTLGDYEYLVVDDASTDGTEPMMRQLTDPRIRYLRLDQWQGANPARNLGIQEARSEWLTFLDSDDEYVPQRLELLAGVRQSRPELQLILSSFLTMKRDQPTMSANPELYLDGDELEQVLMSHGVYIAGTSITVRRSLLLAAGGFTPSILRLQDREALLKLSRLTGAQLLSSVDWKKHPSVDSISRPREGYIESVGAMLRVHPDVGGRYRDLVGYHVARHILTDLLRGRMLRVHQSLHANYAASSLQFSPSELVACYRRGRKYRRRLHAKLQSRAQSSVMESEFPHLETNTSVPTIPHRGPHASSEQQARPDPSQNTRGAA